MNLMILGNARHGKDTVCEFLQKNHGLTFESSSHFVGLVAVAPYLAAHGITYPDYETMYADRVNHRKEWFDAIELYNKDDGARLAKELYAKYDVYCGMRSKFELDALKAQGLVDFVIWVDASKRVTDEDASSITVTQADANFVLDNNGPLSDLPAAVAEALTVARHYVGSRRMLHNDL